LLTKLVKIAKILNKKLRAVRSSNLQLARNLRSTLTLSKKETISSSSIKWREKPRCAEIGRYLVSASSKINARSLMANTNWWKRLTYQAISRPRSAFNFIQRLTALTVTDVSFFTHNLIFSTRRISAMNKSLKRM